MIRLYMPVIAAQPFHPGRIIPLQDDHVHYVRHVLRHTIGDAIHLFNEQEGEWRCIIHSLTKSRSDVELIEQVRPVGSGAEPFVGLLFSPLKHDPLLYLVEKATELGVNQLQPVLMERSVVSKINQEKLYRNGIEASQQCERLDVPEVRELVPLRTLLSQSVSQSGPKKWPEDQILLVCCERHETKFIGEVLREIDPSQKVFFLIGPEGGISPAEITYLSTLPFVRFCHLGPRILRAETAAAYALTAFQVCHLRVR